MKPIQEWTGVTPEIFAREILPAGRPAVFRGLVRDWPVVQAGRARPDALADYLKRLDDQMLQAVRASLAQALLKA